MRETAKRAAIATLVVLGIVALALALWQLKLLLALLFLAFIIAAAMRPSIEALRARGVPRGLGIGLHYLALAGLAALLLWLVIPRAVSEIDEAVGNLPETRSELRQEARESTGLKHDVLVGLQERLRELPTGEALVDPAVELGLTAVEIAVGIFFTLAAAAYWIFERDRAERLLCSLLPRGPGRRVRDTWRLVDLKLGAYVRGQGLLILLVSVVLSAVFWAIGLPFWMLLGIFAGVVEIVPVLGPLLAGALAVGVGLTVSLQVALLAGLAVLVVRLLEDYLVIPRVLGDAVGLTPLVVLVSVTATALLFGEFAIILAIPLAAVVATLIDVVVRDKDPAEEEVPTVLFPAKDAEAS